MKSRLYIYFVLTNELMDGKNWVCSHGIEQHGRLISVEMAAPAFDTISIDFSGVSPYA